MTQDPGAMEQAREYMRHQATKSIGELATLMERTAGDCAGCLDGVSEEQSSFSYDEEWSMKEVLGHMLASGKGVNREISNLVTGSAPAGEARMGVVLGADRPIAELRGALAELWVETGRLAASLPEDGAVDRTWDHPAFGPLNFREWIAFQRLHALDHIQQMEKVKAHPGYPKG